MKFFAIFATILAVATALPSSSVWTLQDLSEALQNPDINPNLKPYLEQALNKLMESIFAGHNVNAIIVHFPENIEVVPSPVLPEIVNPIPQPPVSGPLVQLIVNVNSRQEIAPSPVAPEINPGPVIVDRPEDIIIPGPVIVDRPEDIIVPGPIIVDKPEEIIIPGPVIVDKPEEIIIPGPVIVDKPDISNPIDNLIPVPAPVVDGDFGVLV